MVKSTKSTCSSFVEVEEPYTKKRDVDFLSSIRSPVDKCLFQVNNRNLYEGCFSVFIVDFRRVFAYGEKVQFTGLWKLRF